MITVVTNFDNVISDELDKIRGFDANRMCLIQAEYIAGEWRKRIHQDGLAADGSQIGTYSPGYMKVRTGNYPNKGVYKSGKRKGEQKDSGVYTKGKNKGRPRIKYNRTADTDVVASLTRQMESDMKAFPLESGAAVGYSNDRNFQKSQWVENTYKKKIFDLTDAEEKEVMRIADEEVQKALL